MSTNAFKVIQVLFCFHPDTMGGTEVYVESLSKNLEDYGHDIVIAAPDSDNRS